MERSLPQWLFNTKHPSFLEFKKNIKLYKEFVDLTVNKLKHEHARLQYIIMSDDYEKRLGYYVETAGLNSGEGIVGPDPKIHPIIKGFLFLGIYLFIFTISTKHNKTQIYCRQLELFDYRHKVCKLCTTVP